MISLSRTVRIFLSSTFRDFGEERDLLVRKVFPGLRAKLKDRFVELVDVDLRWGITVEQAERGEVLPICLVEIDRARPYFVGMLGERYGWIPPQDAYALDLLGQQPWLEEHRGGRSVTELEILHGVLNNPKMAGRALFYFRSAEYARSKGGEYVAASAEDAARQADLKERIRRSGFPVVEDYQTPAAFAERLEVDLWKILDEAFPADDVPDAFERESLRHEAYAIPRRRLYLGGERYIAALNGFLEKESQRVLIEGASGGGKSALIANWLDGYRKAHPNELIHDHYTGASADAADPYALVRRLCEAIKRVTGSSEEIPGDPQKLMESFSLWLTYASAYAGKENSRWVIVFDALNGIRDLKDLRWFPQFLRERVHVVISCLPGEVLDALISRGAWERLIVDPLDDVERRELLVSFLARYNKTLPQELQAKALAHPLVSNPLFLRTLAEELRLFGVHEELAARLDNYLQSGTVDDLFEKILERVESDCGREAVRATMEGIWASRAGLTEEEILGIANLVPATWAPIRYSLDEALLESGGRLNFGHDYLRGAVADRYVPSEPGRRQVHARLATWFEGRPIDARSAEEVPYQWREAREWDRLKQALTGREMFEAVYADRPNEEFLSYWLHLEREANADIESDYERAWKTWAPDQETKETGDLASRLARFLSYAGRYKDFTEQLARLSLSIDESTQGPEHPETGTSLNNLARLLRSKGDYDGAEPLFRRARAIAEKALGPEHPSTGASLNNLAGLLQDKGDYVGAEPLFRRALGITENAQGPEHPETGASLNNLALVLRVKGDYDGAEPLLRRALAIAETAHGPEHPSTGSSLNNLAGLLQDKGDYVGAEPLFRRALAITEKAQGPEHPSTGTSLDNLAGLLRSNGDYDGAEPLHRRALAIFEKALGPEHPSTGTSLNNLAALLQDKGDYDGAEPLYRRALTIGEKALGPEHSDTGTRLNNLAELLREKGDYDGAEPLLRRALAIAEKAQGPEHSDTGARLNHLALLLQDKGDYDGAEPLYRRALAIAEKAQGPEHPEIGTSLNNLAGLLQDKGDYDGAEPLYRRALGIAEKAHGPEDLETGTSLNFLALLLQDKGDYDGAEPLYRRALAIAEKAQGPEHPDTAPTLNCLGETLAELGNIDEAEMFFRREIKIIESLPETQPQSIAASYQNLGILLRDAGRLDAADIDLKAALSIYEKTNEKDSIEASSTISALGQLRVLQARYSEAEEFFKSCLQIREAKLEPDDERISLIQNRLADLYDKMGRTLRSETLSTAQCALHSQLLNNS